MFAECLACRMQACCLLAATPLHLPQLIGPMQHYLWILKTCHAGADMDVALEMARYLQFASRNEERDS